MSAPVAPVAPAGLPQARPSAAAPWPMPPALRVGGMAFGNGVLMRSAHHWAWARDDGSVVHGRVRTTLDSSRWLRLPVVRSAVTFLELIVFTVARHRENGRRAGRRLLLWLAVYVAVCAGATFVLSLPGWDGLLAEAVVQVMGLALGLTVLRLGLGADVWRYHGAEHKAVNAYEAGADLGDLGEVMRHSRIHDRCGTNLVVIVLALTFAYLPLQGWEPAQAAGGLYAVLAVALAFELFRLLTRRPQAWLTRAVLFGGRAAQRWVTTREPDSLQLGLACAALRRVVELEVAETAPAVAAA